MNVPQAWASIVPGNVGHRFDWLTRRRAATDARVLEAICNENGQAYGLGIWRTVGRGNIYFSLVRLEREGKIVSSWESLPPGEDRPRRRLYRLA